VNTGSSLIYSVGTVSHLVAVFHMHLIWLQRSACTSLVAGARMYLICVRGPACTSFGATVRMYLNWLRRSRITSFGCGDRRATHVLFKHCQTVLKSCFCGLLNHGVGWIPPDSKPVIGARVKGHVYANLRQILLHVCLYLLPLLLSTPPTSLINQSKAANATTASSFCTSKSIENTNIEGI
jgi:hypothetical protein